MHFYASNSPTGVRNTSAAERARSPSQSEQIGVSQRNSLRIHPADTGRGASVAAPGHVAAFNSPSSAAIRRAPPALQNTPRDFESQARMLMQQGPDSTLFDSMMPGLDPVGTWAFSQASQERVHHLDATPGAPSSAVRHALLSAMDRGCIQAMPVSVEGIVKMKSLQPIELTRGATADLVITSRLSEGAHYELVAASIYSHQMGCVIAACLAAELVPDTALTGKLLEIAIGSSPTALRVQALLTAMSQRLPQRVPGGRPDAPLFSLPIEMGDGQQWMAYLKFIVDGNADLKPAMVAFHNQNSGLKDTGYILPILHGSLVTDASSSRLLTFIEDTDSAQGTAAFEALRFAILSGQMHVAPSQGGPLKFKARITTHDDHRWKINLTAVLDEHLQIRLTAVSAHDRSAKRLEQAFLDDELQVRMLSPESTRQLRQYADSLQQDRNAPPNTRPLLDALDQVLSRTPASVLPESNRNGPQFAMSVTTKPLLDALDRTLASFLPPSNRNVPQFAMSIATPDRRKYDACFTVGVANDAQLQLAGVVFRDPQAGNATVLQQYVGTRLYPGAVSQASANELARACEAGAQTPADEPAFRALFELIEQGAFTRNTVPGSRAINFAAANSQWRITLSACLEHNSELTLMAAAVHDVEKNRTITTLIHPRLRQASLTPASAQRLDNSIIADVARARPDIQAPARRVQQAILEGRMKATYRSGELQFEAPVEDGAHPRGVLVAKASVDVTAHVQLEQVEFRPEAAPTAEGSAPRARLA